MRVTSFTEVPFWMNEWMTLFRSKNWSNIEKTNKTKSKKKQVEVHPLLTFPLLPHILFQQKGIGWISVSCVELHFGPDKAKGKVTEIHHQECVASKTIVLQWNMCRMCAPLLAARCIFFFLNVFNCTAPHFPLFTYEGWACMQLTFTDITGCFSPKRALSLAFEATTPPVMSLCVIAPLQNGNSEPGSAKSPKIHCLTPYKLTD